MATEKRKQAMKWWNNLSSLQKTQLCDINTKLIGSIRRHETLTGREIEMLFEEGYEVEGGYGFEENTGKNRGTQRSPFGIGS